MLLFVVLLAWAQRDADTGDSPRSILAFRRESWLSAYREWDAQYRNGLGFSDTWDSGTLGWGESRFLRNYMLAYAVSGSRYWLDKVQDHFDRILSHATDPDGDGFLGWQDEKYSVGVLRVVRSVDAEGLTLEPTLQRPYVNHGGEKVTGHRYRISLPAADRLQVADLTTDKVLHEAPYSGESVITVIPGGRFQLKGKGRTGAQFEIETTAPNRIPYVVHEGMLTYPVALWAETVLGDEELKRIYGAKAKMYLHFLARHLLDKWEGRWQEFPDGTGAYRFTDDPTERFPGYLLPHNQYLALGRTWLVLQSISDFPYRERCRDKAVKMARYFRKHLRERDGCFVWNYWDPAPGEDVRRYVEDTSHGSIDVGFAVEACRRGVVFTDADLIRLARTYTGVMWNGSLTESRVAGRVDGTGEERVYWWEWCALALWEPKVWDIVWAMARQQRYPVSMAPMLLWVAQEINGGG